MPISRRFAPILALCLAGPVVQPAMAAEGWTGQAVGGSGRSAGYLLGDATPALLFRCAGAGRLALVVSGGAGLPRDADYTVVVSVDGVAFIAAARSGATASGELVRIAPFEAFSPLIAALKAGKAAEVSTPRGRYVLPLRGSGKALAVLGDGCDV
ncbi:hypothetical protein Sa4125_46390 [Aureimonas sp. SA4125]|uniref:hypothetical protein n=1 Tax=Aureimonas sp. SA4125 TaxID=2826993 RepID=UPI001CC75EE7|nr:hypothetical protein [Aureimonas sp. SA4125]BDA87097.1 hypothetical protein Sa4125_46390 [Aureimonas sp. SA4125]